MRLGTARALIAAQRDARAVVLFTPLDGGLQRLLDMEGLALLALTDPGLATAGREALRSDRTHVYNEQVLVTPHNPPQRLIIVGRRAYQRGAVQHGACGRVCSHGHRSAQRLPATGAVSRRDAGQ